MFAWPPNIHTYIHTCIHTYVQGSCFFYFNIMLAVKFIHTCICKSITPNNRPFPLRAKNMQLAWLASCARWGKNVTFIYTQIKCQYMGTLLTFMTGLWCFHIMIVACALLAYRADQELASRANPVVFRRFVVELGWVEQNYLREHSHWICRLNTATTVVSFAAITVH